MSLPCDTEDGIRASLASLSAFYALLQARAEAQSEPLRAWIVHGTLLLDAAGRCGPIEVEGAPRLLDVELRDAFWQRNPGASFTARARTLPGPESICPECGCNWTVATLHDSVERARFAHAACATRALGREQAGIFRGLFADAGFEQVEVAAIPNRYWQIPGAPPWFRVSTSLGPVTVGWRKRVIEVRYADVLSADLFLDCSDTHGVGIVHAWAWARAGEVLRVIRLSAARRKA